MRRRSANTSAAVANLPHAAVPEGQLYPIELRLNLAEIYRETGDDEAARRQVSEAESLVDQLHIEGTARQSSCGCALPYGSVEMTLRERRAT